MSRFSPDFYICIVPKMKVFLIISWFLHFLGFLRCKFPHFLPIFNILLFFQMTMSRIYPDFWTLICNFLRWMCCSDTSFSELFLSRICMVIQYLEDTNAKGAYRKLSFFIECFQGHDSNFRMISSPWELRIILKYYFISMCFDMV